MSQENVEIVQRVYDAFERRRLRCPAALRCDVDWDSSACSTCPTARVYRGHDGVALVLPALARSWDDAGGSSGSESTMSATASWS